MKTILINHPGDGDWVMARVGGVFNEKTDHVIALHLGDGRIGGGVVYTGFLGAAIFVHMAGTEGNWATPDFLWMVFDYAFNQLGCRKLFGIVPVDNPRAMKIDFRLGFKLAARLREVTVDGGDVFILEMSREQHRNSPWGKYVPRYYRRKQDQMIRQE